MSLLDFIRPDRPTMEVCMMGPRAVGKTTILTSVFNETKTSIASTNLKLVDRGDTGEQLDDRYKQLMSVFEEREDISTVGAGINATNYESKFQFSFGIVGKDPSVDLNISDFPGEYVVNNTDKVKEFIEKSTAVFIAIDTPHLMELDGKFNEIKNKVTDITKFFKETIKDIDSEKLILLIPLKCEKYAHTGRLEEVLEKVETTYKDLIALFKENPKICCAVTPIHTLGDVEFDKFSYDSDGKIVLDVDGTPKNVVYKYINDNPQYEPRFCSQPLYSILSFVAAQYTRSKNSGGIWNKIKSAIWDLFKSDEELFNEILKMERNRISDNEKLGYKVLCGGRLFHYNH